METMYAENAEAKTVVTKQAMTVTEMAEYLGIGKTKAYELVNIPNFPCFRIGRSIRVFKTRLDKWLENNQAI